VAATVESTAMCLWFDEWLDARQADAFTREVAAAETIASFPTWESWNSQFVDQSARDYIGTLLVAVEAGNEAPVQRHMALNCGC
jgi:hypothetical protein